MSKIKTVFERGNYYHIYNREINKQVIFRENKNYLFLLDRVQKYVQKFDVSIIAYCLMPNHYHFLVRQNSDKSISDFIQAIFNSYTKAFNNRHNRSGPLFEGRFRLIKVDKQDYLIHLCA
jgi:REP element-mobilizing transposase RayT